METEDHGALGEGSQAAKYETFTSVNPADDRRSKSVPPQNILRIPEAARSCSANRESSFDKDTTINSGTIISRPTEAKTAFEYFVSLDKNIKGGWMADAGEDVEITANVLKSKDSQDFKEDKRSLFSKEGRPEHDKPPQQDRASLTRSEMCTTPTDFPTESKNIQSQPLKNKTSIGLHRNDQEPTCSLALNAKASSQLSMRCNGDNEQATKMESGSGQHDETQGKSDVPTSTGRYQDSEKQAKNVIKDKSDTPLQPLVTSSLELSDTRRKQPTTLSQLPLQFTTDSSTVESDTSRTRQDSKDIRPQQRRLSHEAARKLSTSLGNFENTESRRNSQARRRRSSVAASCLSENQGSSQPARRSSVHRDSKTLSFGTLASSLVRWKINRSRAAKKTQESIAKDAKHREFMEKTADRIKTDLPRPILVSIQEEACPIIMRTAQAYRSQVGAKHKLTTQAYERLSDLFRDLETPF